MVKNCNIVSEVRVSQGVEVYELATESNFVGSYHRVKKEPGVSIFRIRVEYSTFLWTVPSHTA
jgi:hypothetical protein